ncbi:MAG: CRTAC1 family protein [Planctomycetota bacterium]
MQPVGTPQPVAARPAPLWKRGVITAGFVGLLVFAHLRSRAPDTRPPGANVDAAQHGFALRDVTEAWGIAFTHASPNIDPVLAPIAAQITGTGASLAVVDVDGDGDLDIYATTSRHGAPNSLWINERDASGQPRFRDVAAEAGLADVNRDGVGCSTASLWADVDADGDQDVVIVKWGHPQLFLQDAPLRFRDATATSGLADVWMNSHDGLFLDADRDGLVDLFLGGYFRAEVNLWDVSSTRIMQDSFEFSQNGGRNRFFRNLGDGRFEDVSDAFGIGGDRWTYASTAADFDEDGWTDLYIANDYGAEELLINRKGTGFEPLDVDLDRQSKSGMSASLGDVENRGRLAVYVTNISQPGFLFQGNNLRINRLKDRGALADGPEGPVRNCGWAWGSAFGDLDQDGWQDLVVVNGFISADKTRDYWYDMGKVAGGNGGVFEDALNWPAFEGRSLSGYERTRVLKNRLGRSFVEVGGEVGISDTYDGRGVVLADMDGDGRLDMVVANQNGPLLVYRNEPPADVSAAQWIEIDLVAAPRAAGGSNPDAAGAHVLAHFGDATQLRVVVLGGGFSSQGPRRVHFGLGAATAVDELEVRWPSGRVQVVRDLAAGRIHRIEEPSASEPPTVPKD